MSPILLNAAMTICFVAGKSGGHLLPCITKAAQIKAEHPTAQLYIFSSGGDLDKTIIDKHKNLQHYIPTTLDNPPYQQPWLLPFFAIKTGWYFCKSFYKLAKLKPQKVISFGGFISIPVCMAAKCLGIPFEIYELNVEPGKATVFLAKFTQSVYTCFDSTKKYFPKNTCIHFDYPIRFTANDKVFDRLALLEQYSFSPDRKTILILGGSQGSILLNDVMKETIQKYPELAGKVQIIHQTGQSDPFDYAALYREHKIPSQVFGYHEKLQDFYNLADLIISRAGAGTLFEIKFFGKNCITVPHETANTNHQIKNVLELQIENPEQFKIIKQADFTPEVLCEQLKKLF
ncbi:MAG: UDP-N-acetylglucosamine--N-acetylmuramyl-(pentapeptide) pyrophosphoryl-undecaprenol N-acetylglucosamine transferase [Candidatus Babeliales bacterium]|jgi:UDP-N-acetylglucosamine--N-acetylmuramyl-(pentapeptide) pyrophosphoryl-undecaprenol N-acetylglucosamine transferase